MVCFALGVQARSLRYCLAIALFYCGGLSGLGGLSLLVLEGSTILIVLHSLILI